MDLVNDPVLWFLGFLLTSSALGVIMLRQPVHACLSFLMTLLALSALYIELSAEFIAMMQIWVYAGAILVIFMFVVVLFQDAHRQISKNHAKSYPLVLFLGASIFLAGFLLIGDWLLGLSVSKETVPADFGSMQTLGPVLFIDYAFPFEAITLLFLIAVIGSLYIARKEE